MRYHILETIFRGHKVRRAPNGWLVFLDVCEALGLKNRKGAFYRVPKAARDMWTFRDVKGRRRPGQQRHRQHRIISPAGVLYLALTGTTLRAEKFGLWLHQTFNAEYFEIRHDRRQHVHAGLS